MRFPALCSCVLAAAASQAYADPLVGTSLPDATRWVMHVDVDSARNAKPLWELARVTIWQPHAAEFEPQLAMFERATGMSRNQLHDVTLYGQSFESYSACLRLHGVMSKDTITSTIRVDGTFTQVDHNGHDILSWRDKDQGHQIYAGFDAHLPPGASNTWVILSRDMHAVEKALDAMDGTAAAKADTILAPVASLAAGAPLLWVAARDLSELPRTQQVESPVLTQLENATFAISWNADRVVTDIHLDTRSEETAQQLKDVAQGIKSFVALSAADNKSPLWLRLASGAFQQLKVDTAGKAVSGQWSMESKKLELLVELISQEQVAKPAAKDAVPH